MSTPKAATPAHDEPNSPVPVANTPKPSVTLLFSLLPRRDIILFVLPAVLTSALAGAVAPFMTLTIGQSFDAFSTFQSDHDKHRLLHNVGIAALELLGLAAAAFLITSVTSSLWVWAAERNLRTLRRRVYAAVVRKELAWFDQHAAEDAGAGGLMARFTRETDDVRQAVARAAGFIIQHLVTVIAALALAFARSWELTLLILVPVPIVLFIQGLSQGLVIPLFVQERASAAAAASRIDRAVQAIATVKAFNAQRVELAAFSEAIDHISVLVRKASHRWGVTIGASQFTAMTMFVEAFWFGSKLVREGKLSSGDVMTVFWACLIATSTLQTAVPFFSVLGKGASSMAELCALIDEPVIPTRPLRKIVPKKCDGQLNLEHITFAYPARPEQPVLEDVSIFIEAGETTFIVGGSGSGKSSMAALLLGLYKPQAGSVQLDEQDVRFLDQEWLREQVAGVAQTAAVFDGTVRENIELGLSGKREAWPGEVEEACRMAFLEDWVQGLPDGYDTRVGTSGASLSGGQKQRLALARAQLRGPKVLILDEATSALDATTRVLVFEAIRHWRQGLTTVVITHDLAQITSDDFVYVLESGHVAQQGYRRDLEVYPGAFRTILASQGKDDKTERDDDAEVQEALEEMEAEVEEEERTREKVSRHRSIMPLRPLTMGTWVFEAFGRTHRDRDAEAVMRPPSAAPATGSLGTSSAKSSNFPAFAPTSMVEDDEDFEVEKDALKRSAAAAEASRRRVPAERKRWEGEAADAEIKADELATIRVDTPLAGGQPAHLSFGQLMRKLWPTVPRKGVFVFGLLLALANGVMTPVFSFVLSKLMFEVSVGATDVHMINVLGGLVIGVTALDGVFVAAKHMIMESIAIEWVNGLRRTSYDKVLRQDKAWFDRAENAPVRMVQILLKDGDDARSLIATVFAQALVIITMLTVGLLWALIRGWQLTLVGIAITPLFAGCMLLQSKFVAGCEVRNKRARENVAKVYYDAIANVRGIRAMAFESVFERKFEDATNKALSGGVRGAFIEGCTMGVSSGLIYLAEALLFYVGAMLIANGTWSYLRMVETLNLIIFSVSIASQMLTFGDRIAKSMQAVRDFNRLLDLDTDTDESRGDLQPPYMGDIRFNKIKFAYPERSDVLVADGLSMTVQKGECVAIVGASGCGKSTVASLLQRLYEPTAGSIYIGSDRLRDMNAGRLREYLAVVSQQPNLFDASVADNIAYGTVGLTRAEIEQAAVLANVHEFITSLPDGYDTHVGDNAALVSGGQAQRIQIARALARRDAGVLVLDEATSALDGLNQVTVMDSVRAARRGRTTIVITHKLPVMQMCDRIVLLEGGRVAEEGQYTELLRRKGLFAQLASGGEWDSA